MDSSPNKRVRLNHTRRRGIIAYRRPFPTVKMTVVPIFPVAAPAAFCFHISTSLFSPIIFSALSPILASILHFQEPGRIAAISGAPIRPARKFLSLSLHDFLFKDRSFGLCPDLIHSFVRALQASPFSTDFLWIP